jgi:hypothetical protein
MQGPFLPWLLRILLLESFLLGGFCYGNHTEAAMGSVREVQAYLVQTSQLDLSYVPESHGNQRDDRLKRNRHKAITEIASYNNEDSL